MTGTDFGQSGNKLLAELTALPDEARLDAFRRAFAEGFDANTAGPVMNMPLPFLFLRTLFRKNALKSGRAMTRTIRISGPTSASSLHFFWRMASMLRVSTAYSAHRFSKRSCGIDSVSSACTTSLVICLKPARILL